MTANPKIPPHSDDAEKGVLGSILLDPPVALPKVIDAGVKPDTFYNRQNEVLFENIIEMDKSGKSLDVLTLAEWLKDNGALDAVGGLDRLTELQDWTLVPAHANEYSDIVIEHKKLRRIIESANDAIMRAYRKDEAKDIANIAVVEIEAVNEASGDIRTTADIAKDLIVLDKKIVAGEPIGLPFPWPELQKKTFGIPFSAVSPLTGRDGRGKSRLATYLAVHWASIGFAGLIFPFEDTELRCLRNAASNFGEYDAFNINNPYASPTFMDTHIESIKRTSNLPLYICDYANKIDQIVSMISLHKRKHDIEWVIIDGFKDVFSSGGENRTQEEVKMMRELTAAARKYGVAIIPVMHINKIEDSKWISKQDITGSGDQTKSARMVMVYQDFIPEELKNKFAPNCYDEGLLMLDVQKASYGNRAIFPLIKNLEQGRFDMLGEEDLPHE